MSARLKRQLDAAVRDTKLTRGARGDLFLDVALDALGEADELAAALREFGTHKLSCAWRKPRPSNFMKRACDCGLDAALAKVQP